MKTDIEIIREMLTRSRIAFGYALEKRSGSGIPVGTAQKIVIGEHDDFIVRKDSDKEHEGYYGFYANFCFDKDGTLLNIGVWE